MSSLPFNMLGLSCSNFHVSIMLSYFDFNRSKIFSANCFDRKFSLDG